MGESQDAGQGGGEGPDLDLPADLGAIEGFRHAGGRWGMGVPALVCLCQHPFFTCLMFPLTAFPSSRAVSLY